MWDRKTTDVTTSCIRLLHLTMCEPNNENNYNSKDEKNYISILKFNHFQLNVEYISITDNMLTKTKLYANENLHLK